MAINTKHTKTNHSNIHKECTFVKSSLIRVIDLFDEGILFLSDSPQKRYSANSITMAIWDLIDGNRTSEEIAREIATVGEVNLAEIEDDIFLLLATLRKLGFVKEVKETTRVICE
ncbi:MAG: PqqD family protein [Bacteroidia bacterium]|nr:PqqD family protein [Bacteroidia bacterium]